MKAIYISSSSFEFTEKFGMLCERLKEGDIDVYAKCDENYSDNLTNKSLCNQIDASSFVFFLFNAKSVRQAFELGYAIGRGKKVVIFGNIREIPLDAKDVEYQAGNIDGSEMIYEVEKRLGLLNDNEETISDLINNPKQAIERFISDKGLCDSIDYYTFEKVIGTYLSSNGYDLRKPADRRDVGADYLLFRNQHADAIVEIKKYRRQSQVSISVVQQVFGSMTANSMKSAFIISNVPFTNSAIYFANKLGVIKLVSLESLLDEKLPAIFSS